MGRSLLASAALVTSCRCGDAEVKPAPPPVDPGPGLAPWSGPENVDGPGHLSTGAVKVTVRLSALPAALRPTKLADVDPEQPLSATLGGRAHHRIAWTQRPGTSWRDVLPEGTACAAFDDADCRQLPEALLGVVQQGERVRVDIVTDESAAFAQQLFELPVGGGPSLRGDIVAEWNGLHTVLGHPPPAAVTRGDFAFTVDEAKRLRVRWMLAEAPEAAHSHAAAPSWIALCDGARACARTGPWPAIGGWLARHPPNPMRIADAPSALAAAATEWPHLLSAMLERSRASLHPAARAFFDQALWGVGDVAFAGGRLDDDGTGIAFLRVSAPWVNFTASALAHAGYPSAPRRLEDGTEVSWAPMLGGGVIMALDDGRDPAMGWIAFASTPDRFTWMKELPRTQAGPSSATARVARLADVLPFAPPALRRALADEEDAGLTVDLRSDDGFLVATAELGSNVQ